MERIIAAVWNSQKPKISLLSPFNAKGCQVFFCIMHSCHFRCSIISNAALSLVLGPHSLRPGFQITLNCSGYVRAFICWQYSTCWNSSQLITPNVCKKPPKNSTSFSFDCQDKLGECRDQRESKIPQWGKVILSLCQADTQGLSKYRFVHCKHP